LLVLTIAGLLTLITTTGCERPSGQRSFVARVGNAYLTHDELRARSGAASDSSEASLRFVNEWVSNELLYQEAVRREFDKQEPVRERMEAVQKRIAVEALLDEVLFQDSAEVGEDEVTAYFPEHEQEFMLSEDVALVSFARFNERGPANTFRSGIVRGKTWDQAVDDLSTDSMLVAHLLQITHQQYVTRSTLFPEELWKVARTLNPSKVSFVVTTDSGYYVLFLHDFRRQGTIPDLSYVAPEIHGRLMIDKRRKRYEEFLEGLRSRFPVEVRSISGPPEGTSGGGD